MTHILAFGGGVNSVALAVRMVREKMPLDHILFSDTLGEKLDTYLYFDVLNKHLVQHSYPPITVLEPYRAEGLYGECKRLERLPSIVYGFKSCSEKWKRRPYLRFLKEKGFQEVTCYKGIDAGEAHRIKDYSTSKEKVVFPLVDWDMDRFDCVKEIVDAGLPIPPKSSCFFCPSSTKREVVELSKNDRRQFEAAVALEAGASETLTKIKGLGRRWRWRDIVLQAEFDFEVSPVQIACDCHE